MLNFSQQFSALSFIAISIVITLPDINSCRSFLLLFAIFTNDSNKNYFIFGYRISKCNGVNKKNLVLVIIEVILEITQPYNLNQFVSFYRFRHFLSYLIESRKLGLRSYTYNKMYFMKVLCTLDASSQPNFFCLFDSWYHLSGDDMKF